MNRSFCDLGALGPYHWMFSSMLDAMYLGVPRPKPISLYTSCPMSVRYMPVVRGVVRVDLAPYEWIGVKDGFFQ